MLKSTISLLGLLLLPIIIFMQIGSIKTNTIIIMGAVYFFTMVFTFIKEKGKEDAILNESLQILSREDEKKLDINSIAEKLSIDKDNVFNILQVFKRQKKIPYNVDLVF